MRKYSFDMVPGDRTHQAKYGKATREPGAFRKLPARHRSSEAGWSEHEPYVDLYLKKTRRALPLASLASYHGATAITPVSLESWFARLVDNSNLPGGGLELPLGGTWTRLPCVEQL